MVQSKRIKDFQTVVWDYYRQIGRHDLPWRHPRIDGSFDVYEILVSEMMLQQTQVQRVIPKFQAFLATFPTIESLASAPLSTVLKSWSGLGYNRRAKYLHDASKALVSKDGPWKQEELVRLKGIGPNTASAVRAYAYNVPVIFIETNIRSVFIHHFFAGKTEVADKDLLPLIKKALDHSSPREWYWALMDYGVYLKSMQPNPSRRSKHYAKQSPFAGSLRKIRGQVLKELAQGEKTEKALEQSINDDRLRIVLHSLVKDGLIREAKTIYSLAE